MHNAPVTYRMVAGGTFGDDDGIILELLRSNDINYALDVSRINLKTGEAVAKLWFIGLEKGRYPYIENGQNLYIQSAEETSVIRHPRARGSSRRALPCPYRLLGSL